MDPTDRAEDEMALIEEAVVIHEMLATLPENCRGSSIASSFATRATGRSARRSRFLGDDRQPHLALPGAAAHRV